MSIEALVVLIVCGIVGIVLFLSVAPYIINLTFRLKAVRSLSRSIPKVEPPTPTLPEKFHIASRSMPAFLSALREVVEAASGKVDHNSLYLCQLIVAFLEKRVSSLKNIGNKMDKYPEWRQTDE